ncbi:MAG: T9SS type A sorting domain-containing protein [bacterium]
MKTLILICAVILSLNLQASAVIKNVPSQYTTIQAAINASVNGDTILVQPGTYFENINFRGKRIVLTGSFYQSNNYSLIQTTIINGSTPVYPDSASCVIFNNREDSATVIQGFTITGGTGTKWKDEHSPGIYREGGGILSALSSPVIQFNIISGNNSVPGGVESTGGGGIRIGDGYVRVYNNIITNNSSRYGAGVTLNYTGADMKNNLIYKNFGASEFGAGAAIWLNGFNARAVTIINNTLVYNSATSGTGGLAGLNGASGFFRNNIVWGNTSPNNIQISASGVTVRYCDVQGGAPGGGNFNSDPGFDTTNYYIKTNSVCVDKGDSSLIYQDVPDPNNPSNAKWPSHGTLRNDVGAYGGPLSKVIAYSVVGVNLISTETPENFTLSQNYPNPFNPSTNLEFKIMETGFVSLRVYDELGREVAKLIDEVKSAGVYEVQWNAAGLPSGVYFYRLTAGNFTDVKKMTLLK